MAVVPVRKVDRDEVFLELTRSVCPVCKRVIDAEPRETKKRKPKHKPTLQEIIDQVD